jgi:hypothetical protein
MGMVARPISPESPLSGGTGKVARSAKLLYPLDITKVLPCSRISETSSGVAASE